MRPEIAKEGEEEEPQEEIENEEFAAQIGDDAASEGKSPTRRPAQAGARGSVVAPKLQKTDASLDNQGIEDDTRQRSCC